MRKNALWLQKMYIDSTLYEGRSHDKRIEKEEACYDLLDRLDIKYYRVDHEHADTIEACEDVEKILGCKICKNLLLTNRQQTAVYFLAMPGEKPFKTKILSKQIGSARLSFASEEQMMRTLNITPGSVSVLGLINDEKKEVRLLVDRDLLTEEYFGCHPCINTSSLKIKTDDVMNKIIPAAGHSVEYVELPWVIEE